MFIPNSVKKYLENITIMERTLYSKQILILLKCFHLNNYLPMTSSEISRNIGTNASENIEIWNKIVKNCFQTISSCKDANCIIKDPIHRICCKEVSGINYYWINGGLENSAAIKIQKRYYKYRKQFIERNKAVLIIQRKCHNWLYKPICKDGKPGINMKIGSRRFKQCSSV